MLINNYSYLNIKEIFNDKVLDTFTKMELISNLVKNQVNNEEMHLTNNQKCLLTIFTNRYWTVRELKLNPVQRAELNILNEVVNNRITYEDFAKCFFAMLKFFSNKKILKHNSNNWSYYVYYKLLCTKYYQCLDKETKLTEMKANASFKSARNKQNIALRNLLGMAKKKINNLIQAHKEEYSSRLVLFNKLWKDYPTSLKRAKKTCMQLFIGSDVLRKTYFNEYSLGEEANLDKYNQEYSFFINNYNSYLKQEKLYKTDNFFANLFMNPKFLGEKSDLNAQKILSKKWVN